MDTQKKLLISGIATVLAFLFVFFYIKNREQELLLLSEMVPVLVSEKDILVYTQLDETMMKVIKVPKKFAQPGALQNTRDAIGQVVSAPIMKNEQIVGTKLLRFGTETGLSMKIPSGHRAVSISVNNVTGVAHLVQPNDFVDLLVTFDFGDKTQSRAYTYTLFENLQVLAVQKNLGHAYSALAEKRERKKGVLGDLMDSASTSSRAMTYTLAVTPEETQKLILAQETGKITVSLRSLWESKNKLKLSPITPADLTGLKSLVKQRQQPAYMEYRGGRR